MSDQPNGGAARERIDQLSEAANVQGLVTLQNEMRKSFQVTTRLLLFVTIMIPSLIFQNAYLGLVGSVVLAGSGSGGRFRNVIGGAGFAAGLGGAVSGAALGSAGGPPGAIAGFAIGAV